MSRSKRWIFILLTFFATGGSAYALGVHWMLGAAHGSVSSGQPAAAPVNQYPPLVLTNRYFRTRLPEGFVVKRTDDTPVSALGYRILAVTPGEPDEQFAATVTPLPSDGLKGAGDYNLRVTYHALYAPYSFPGLPSGAVAFRSTTGTPAFTVFWQHSDYFVELAFSSSGAASYDQLDRLSGRILSNWTWQ